MRGRICARLAVFSFVTHTCSHPQVIPALLGDCAFTNSMRLDDMAAWTAAVKAGLFGKRRGALPAAFEHPRFFTVETEENHFVQVRGGVEWCGKLLSDWESHTPPCLHM